MKNTLRGATNPQKIERLPLAVVMSMQPAELTDVEPELRSNAHGSYRISTNKSGCVLTPEGFRATYEICRGWICKFERRVDGTDVHYDLWLAGNFDGFQTQIIKSYDFDPIFNEALRWHEKNLKDGLIFTMLRSRADKFVLPYWDLEARVTATYEVFLAEISGARGDGWPCISILRAELSDRDNSNFPDLAGKLIDLMKIDAGKNQRSSAREALGKLDWRRRQGQSITEELEALRVYVRNESVCTRPAVY